MALTKRQKEVLNYLVGFLNKNGYSPSFEEIARAMKLTSLATVHKHLSTLEKKGFIRRGYNQSRSIEVVQLPKPIREEILDRHVVELPLAGRIAAGRPLEAVEERDRAVVPAVGVGVERAEPPPGALLHPVLAATIRRQNRAVFIMPSAAVNAGLEFWFRSQHLPPSFDT